MFAQGLCTNMCVCMISEWDPQILQCIFQKFLLLTARLQSCSLHLHMVLDMHNSLICHKYYLVNKSCFGYDFSWTSTELQNGNFPLKSQKRYPSHLLNHLLIGKLHSVSKLKNMKYIFSLCESWMHSINREILQVDISVVTQNRQFV